MARALKTCRLYSDDNPLVQSVRDSTVDLLLQLVRAHGGWRLRFQPNEILLEQERIIAAAAKTTAQEATFSTPESRLPFLFYRDGIRAIHVQPSMEKAEALAFFDALVTGCGAEVQTDDLVTLLWQANLSNVAVEAAPIEQTFHLSDQASGEGDSRPRGSGLQAAAAVSGGEVRADLGQAPGAQGLHRDTFDDWALPGETSDVRDMFERLNRRADALRHAALEQWESERAGAWDARVPELFQALVAADPTDDTRAAFGCAAASWATNLLAEHELASAGRALQLLDQLDPERAHAAETLKRGMEHVNDGDLTDFLDESQPADQGQFAALMVRLGDVAVPLAYAVMARATRSRVRAAAATALCYQCADTPQLLEPFLDEPRPEAMLNLVFVLGQIGGAAVAPMLRAATRHADSRVRRQAVLSLGGVPEAERTPVLLDELARLDPHILSTTLGMLARQRDENVTRFILGLIKDPEFEAKGEDVQRALFSALAEVADDGVVSVLDKILNRSQGWLGRRSYTQFAAALTLRRLGTPTASRVLELGLKSRNGAVRSACVDAMNARAA